MPEVTHLCTPGEKYLPAFFHFPIKIIGNTVLPIMFALKNKKVPFSQVVKF